MPPEEAADDTVAGSPRRTAHGFKALWARFKPWLIGAFFTAVAVLLFRLSGSIDWALAWQSVRSYKATTLLLASALAAASYAVYCTYDLIGRHQTRHGLPAGRVSGVAFVSYAFNLNLGALVGGVAMRYRLYSRLGLDAAQITQVLGLSLLTNWLGYLLLGGLVFALHPLALPPEWKMGSGGLRWLGVAMLGAVLAYLCMCWRSKRRDWTVRAQRFKLPSGRVALLQLGLSSVNWLLIAGVVFVLLRNRIDYASVLAVLLVAAVAGVISHIPAGLGVLEAVFLALLSHRAGQDVLMAALLAYRAVYYLAPLAVATVYFVVTGIGPKPDVSSSKSSAAAPIREQ